MNNQLRSRKGHEKVINLTGQEGSSGVSQGVSAGVLQRKKMRNISQTDKLT